MSAARCRVGCNLAHDSEHEKKRNQIGQNRAGQDTELPMDFDRIETAFAEPHRGYCSYPLPWLMRGHFLQSGRVIPF